MVSKWIQKGMDVLETVIVKKRPQWISFKVDLLKTWDLFKVKFPTFSSAFKGVDVVSSVTFKNAYKLYQRFQGQIKLAAKGALVLFTIGISIFYYS